MNLLFFEDFKKFKTMKPSHASDAGPALAIGDNAIIATGLKIQAVGGIMLRYGLVVVLAWIGAMKFTGYEAKAIQPLVASSPFMGWMYNFVTVQQFSTGLGCVEIAIATLIALRPWSAMLAVIGSAAAAGTFLTTLSFIISSPGWEPSLGGFPALSAGTGEFVIKDLVLLGASIWLLGEAWKGLSRVSPRVMP